MAECSKRGIAYESVVREVCAQFRFNDAPLFSAKSAGCSHGCDLILQVSGRQIGIEIKNRRATECGQRTLHICESAPHERILALPEAARVHRAALGNHIPFGGYVPRFLSATTETERRNLWREEKAKCADETLVEIPSTIIRDYYAEQGSSYMQLEGFGLYRTGADDPLQTKAPLFECQTKVRIRCKRHGKKGAPPRSIQVSLVMCAKARTIPPSQFSLDSCDKVPLSLARIAQP